MNRLNMFNYYSNLKPDHENILTRNLLILIKNIPMVQNMFFAMIREEMKKTLDFPLYAFGDLQIAEIDTQKSDNNDEIKRMLEGRKVVSVVISDDRLETDLIVESSERSAIYDGVIITDPIFAFIIENKPSKGSVWLEQLKPNMEEIDGELVEEPCCLSWREILDNLNKLLQNEIVSGLEKLLIDDFLEYVDTNYVWLNPFTKFGQCKGEIYLLNKRCRAIMSELEFEGEKREVNYHKGWKYYIKSGENTIKQIALDAHKDDNGFTVKLWLYAGDTMSAARETYRKLDVENLFRLGEKGFKLSSNFHVSYRSSNLLWFEGTLSFEEYIRFWKSEYVNLRQIKREEFESYFKYLEDNNIILKSDKNRIKDTILNKRYDKLNICPGIGIFYTWDQDTAIALDDKGGFLKDLEQKLSLAFDTMK